MISVDRHIVEGDECYIGTDDEGESVRNRCMMLRVILTDTFSTPLKTPAITASVGRRLNSFDNEMTDMFGNA